MATYNFGSVNRVVAVYNAAPVVGVSAFSTLYQAPALPTISRISGVVRLGSDFAFGFFATQNNIATGSYFFVNSGGTIASYLANQGFGGPAVSSPAALSGAGFVLTTGGVAFTDFIVPAGFFVQFRNGPSFITNFAHTITRVDTTLT